VKKSPTKGEQGQVTKGTKKKRRWQGGKRRTAQKKFPHQVRKSNQSLSTFIFTQEKRKEARRSDKDHQGKKPPPPEKPPRDIINLTCRGGIKQSKNYGKPRAPLKGTLGTPRGRGRRDPTSLLSLSLSQRSTPPEKETKNLNHHPQSFRDRKKANSHKSESALSSIHSRTGEKNPKVRSRAHIPKRGGVAWERRNS